MHRQVHRLRFTCARAEDARHGRVLLEDALRTATLGDEGRLILVRQLDLGRLSARASATHWSRRLEQALRATRIEPVRFDAPEARDAAAVYFRSRDEPWLVLAQRTGSQQRCDEWFWPLALGGWRPSGGAPATLRQCFRALSAHSGLAPTLQLAALLHRLGALPLLLDTLRATDLTKLESTLGLEPATDLSEPETRWPSIVFSEVETACMTAWGWTDIRTRWLIAVHLTRALPAHALPAAFPVSESTIRTLIDAGGRTPEPHKASPSLRRATPVSSEMKPLERGAPVSDERVFTQAGGLFFALPLLVRAGLVAHAAHLPVADAAALPWQILRLILRHSRIADEDPLVLALRDFPPARAPLARWLLAANRQALRLARLNLRQLTRRPALIALTPTHIDVFSRPDDADLRIRRAALDVDPGWVPWLGRTIAYHFNRDN